jgi:hypothetical protein
MVRLDGSRPGLNLEAWLARKIRLRHLRELPPFHANGGGNVHQPEPYARLLLSALRESPTEVRGRERLRDDARAFRSWVEGNQLDLMPPLSRDRSWSGFSRV